MADGKQWYNSPGMGQPKKPAGKTAGGKGKPSKPGMKQSGGRPVSKSGKPAGKNPQAAKHGAKPVSGGKPFSKGSNRPVSKAPQKGASVSDTNTGKSIIPQMEDVKAEAGKKNVQNKPYNKPFNKPVKHGAKPSSKPRAKRPMTAAEKAKAREMARAREQQKILEQAKRKEEAKIREQEKIEKNEYKRKNPSQKSAESRAIRNGILGAVAVASALLVLVFVVHHLYDYIAEKPNFSFVTTGSVEHTIGARALVVRDEDTIECVNGGELVTQITEGSRVAKGQELAIVVPENWKSTVQDLRNVQSQISDVQQEIIMSGGVAEADVIYRNYNKNLSTILDSVRYDSMSGNLSSMSSYSSSVNVILDEREDEMSKINFDDERISVLRNDEAVYEAQLEKYASVVTAHRPGVVSFRLDGKENILAYDQFLSMPMTEIKGYINNSVGAIASDLNVEAETPVVRIAQNESQYLSVYLSSEDAGVSDFAVGTYHDINIRTEGISIDNCQVVRCESDSSGMLITFETSRCVEALLDLRTVDIEIVITETDGMRVSMPSLVNGYYAPKGNPCFCVYLAPGSNVGPDTFAEDAIFNVTIIPNAVTDEEGNPVELSNTSVAGCTVVYTEAMEDGGYIVAFSTPNEYAALKRLDRLYTEGYMASFVDTATGLGMTTDKIIVTDFAGIASVYTNNQGFVEEIRVIILDNDREFAIIDQVGKSSVPNLNTVIITNPNTVKPGDKID